MNDAPQTPPDLTEREKHYLKEAERAHDRHHAVFDNHFKQAGEFGAIATRTVVLTCAGGIAATLGFLSANYARLSRTEGAISEINTILALMFIALVVMIASAACSYLSQIAYSEAMNRRKLSYTLPYVEVTEASKSATASGDALRWLAFAFGVISVLVIIFAAVKFSWIVR